MTNQTSTNLTNLREAMLHSDPTQAAACLIRQYLRDPSGHLRLEGFLSFFGEQLDLFAKEALNLHQLKQPEAILLALPVLNQAGAGFFIDHYPEVSPLFTKVLREYRTQALWAYYHPEEYDKRLHPLSQVRACDFTDLAEAMIQETEHNYIFVADCPQDSLIIECLEGACCISTARLLDVKASESSLMKAPGHDARGLVYEVSFAQKRRLDDLEEDCYHRDYHLGFANLEGLPVLVGYYENMSA